MFQKEKHCWFYAKLNFKLTLIDNNYDAKPTISFNEIKITLCSKADRNIYRRRQKKSVINVTKKSENDRKYWRRENNTAHRLGNYLPEKNNEFDTWLYEWIINNNAQKNFHPT